MNALTAQRALFLFWLLTIAALPFELPIAYAAHGLTKPLVGELYQVFLVGSAGLVVTSALLLAWPIHLAYVQKTALSNYSLMMLLFLAVGFSAVVATIAGITAEYWLSVRQLLLGFLVPVLIGLQLCFLPESDRQKTWLAFYGGWVLLFLISFFFLYDSYVRGIALDPILGSLPLTQKILYWRYTFIEPWNLYGQFVGNTNKTSNYIIIFMFLSVHLLGATAIQTSRLTRLIFYSFWILGTISLFILFSRAAMMLLPFAIFFSRAYRLFSRSTVLGVLLVVAVVIALLPFAFGSLEDVFAYLALGKFLDQEDLGPLGTLSDRFDQWRDIWIYLGDHPRVFLLGLGTGGYGKLFFEGDVERGTHNTFLDTLMESGLTGFLPLVVLFLFMAYLTIDFRRVAVRDGVCLATILALLMLMFREHSFSYLHITSLGGVCMAALFFVLSMPTNNHGQIRRKGLPRSPSLANHSSRS